MKTSIRAGLGLLTTAVVLLGPSMAAPARAETASNELEAVVQSIVADYLAKHPEDIERVVKDYLTKHPEVVQTALQAALAEMAKKRSASRADAAANKAELVRKEAQALFQSPHQVTLGDPNGAITMVEFFDYNCGYCKRALGDMLALMRDDSGLRVVLKEYPILGPGSLEAARVAIAVRMQGASSDKYLAFHQKLLGGRGASKATALAVAAEIGLDPARIERDMESPEVAATLEESARLAKALGITGTPGYVIGDNVIIGAVGLAALSDKIKRR